MPNHLKVEPVWLIGTGNMARQYVKVLRDLEVGFRVIGNSQKSVDAFASDTGIEPFQGGLDAFLRQTADVPPFAINTVQSQHLSECTRSLLQHGVKRILSEKPAGRTQEELDLTAKAAKAQGAEVFVAYNRRFYAATMAARRIIEEDGGVTSMHFEFTELYRVISRQSGDVSKWFFGNASHVLDLAFFLGGLPDTMQCYAKGNIEGYTSNVIFSGAGVSQTGALFSYQANWLSPGRWSVEALTKKHRLIFRPMETLQIQQLGSFSIEPYPIDDDLDKAYKPGLYLQVKTFIDHPEDDRFLRIEAQAEHFRHYQTIYSGIHR